MSQWKELFSEIVATDVCCGCAACVLVCPHDVLDYDFDTEKPFQTDELRPDDCSHGQKGCDICTRACPRMDSDAGIWKWQWPEIEQLLHGRTRLPEESFGIHRQVVVARATDPDIMTKAQDGGIGSALILHGFETKQLDGAVVCGLDSTPWMTQPTLVTTRDEVLGTAGSRYTYCATPLAMQDAFKRKLRKVALVGVSCEVSAAPKMQLAGVRKWSARIPLTIGLLCSETFLPKPFLEAKLQGEWGIDLTKVTKINIKGKVVVTMDDGHDINIPLKDCRPLARDWGCPFCPDFGAEHADISLGGLGMEGWSLTIIRTEHGEKVWNELIAAGKVEVRPASEEPAVVELLEKLAKRQRRRPRNVERELERGEVGPYNVVENEAVFKRGTPEAAFKARGSRSAEPLALAAMAGPSPKGNKS
jgi:coenzyme F420 hydrogenase subunit beta